MTRYTKRLLAIISLGVGIKTHSLQAQPAASLHKDEPTAFVRYGNDICTEEQTAIAARNNKARITLQNYLGQHIDLQSIPSIGLACSGGGLRASIATLGLLRGLEKIGLLDAVTYSAGVSGSTWTMTSWAYHNTDLDTLTRYLQERLENEFHIRKMDPHLIAQIIQNKRASHRPFSINEVWGMLVAHVFLGTAENNVLDARLEDLAPRIQNASFPLPLFATIIGETSPPYQWAEFSPFEIGSTHLNAWIPPSAFGKFFDNGVSYDPYPGESLAYLLGIFGSAYAASVYDAWKKFTSIAQHQYGVTVSVPMLHQFFENKAFRISPPRINNFAQLQGPEGLKDKEYITFVDAGVTCNLPFPPLLRRNVNVYIVCNANTSPQPMIDVQTYAKQHGFILPPIDTKALTKNKLSVFVDKNNLDAPIIIYLPNFHKFPISKSSYTHKQFYQLLNGIEQAVVEHAGVIKAAIGLAVTKKRLSK